MLINYIVKVPVWMIFCISDLQQYLYLSIDAMMWVLCSYDINTKFKFKAILHFQSWKSASVICQQTTV